MKEIKTRFKIDPEEKFKELTGHKLSINNLKYISQEHEGWLGFFLNVCLSRPDRSAPVKEWRIQKEKKPTINCFSCGKEIQSILVIDYCKGCE